MMWTRKFPRKITAAINSGEKTKRQGRAYCATQLRGEIVS